MSLLKQCLTPARLKLIFLVSIAGSMLIANQQFKAAPVSGRIIEQIDVSDDIHRSEINIRFSFPLRYESHFPKQQGKNIRINFRPIAISALDLDALFKRESMVPHKTDLVPLESVVFESDTLGDEQTNLGQLTDIERRQKEEELRTESNFYLILSFSRNVAFAVEQGSDFRSIVVYVCEQHFSQKNKQCEDYQPRQRQEVQDVQE